MLHEERPAPSAQPHPASILRPRKRRRTATEVLAGYFDSPNIHRDFFTDMANTDETIRAVNSIIARNSPLLMDPRFQHIGSLKTSQQSHRHHRHSNPHLRHHHHSSLTAARSYHNVEPMSSQDLTQNTMNSPTDRRSKLMGRIQDISHLLLSRYDSEFIKETPYSSLNEQPPSPCPNTQPSDTQNAPLSPAALVQHESPRQPVSPALLPVESESESRQRSPSITITEEVFERPPSRSDATKLVVENLLSQHQRRASFTASPPTPTRSITSLTSHTSSKWPHTPDNELGPSFPEISGSYTDDFGEECRGPTMNDHTIVGQPQSPPTSSWKEISSSVPSPIPISIPLSPPPPPPPPGSDVASPHWMMMTQIMEEGKRAVESVVPSASRAFSLDNILSPVPSVPGSPQVNVDAAGQLGEIYDHDGGDDVIVGGDDMDVVSRSPPQVVEDDVEMAENTALAAKTDTDTDDVVVDVVVVQPQLCLPEFELEENEAVPLAVAVAVPTPALAPISAPEDIRIPFMATPERVLEREMSVLSDHPLKPRSRRKSKVMKIVESDDETEGERERDREMEKDEEVMESGKGIEWEREREKEREGTKNLRDELLGKNVHPRLTIKIRPLTAASSSSTLSSSSLPKSSLSAVTVAEVQEERLLVKGDDVETDSSVNKLSSILEVPVAATPSFAPETPSEAGSQSIAADSAPPTAALPPLIRGKARKRKAPPARKGWKGWVEVEVDDNDRPIKSLNLDDLPLGERRTRSGKQFDG